jgi:hypothetical protein
MPKLHIVYDPEDKIVSSPEMEKRTRIKVAIMSVPENASKDEMQDIGTSLIRLFIAKLDNDR